MPTRGLIKYFHLAVEALNSKLVEDFQAKDNPREVRIFFDYGGNGQTQPLPSQ